MTRTRSHARVVTTIFLLFLAFPCIAAKPGGGGGGGGNTPSVTSTIHDNPVVGDAYRIRSDYQLTGTNTYYNGVDSVLSQLPDYYELSALSSPNRMMFVDFGEPLVAGTAVPVGALAGATSGFVKGRFIGKYNGVSAMKGVGSTLVSGLPFVFTGIDGAHYQVRMNADNEAGTDDAVFTCTHVAGPNQLDANAACDAWSATPAGAEGKNLGRLVKSQTIRGKTVLTYYGDFYMTFEVTFTKP